MRIGFIAQWFAPERGSAAQATSIAEAMVRQGFEVDVLTGFPNYPEGKIYPGYRIRAHQLDRREGMRVHRVPLMPTHRPNVLSRTVNYVSFGTSAAVAAPTCLHEAQAVLVHLTPALPGVAAATLKALRGVPYVLHVQDLWPDTVTSSGFLSPRLRPVVEPPLHLLLDGLYRGASAVAVTSPGMATKVAARGIPEEKIHFAPNWADEGIFRPETADPSLRSQWGLRPFTIMYAGNLGVFQELGTLLDVAARTKDLPHVGYAIVGGGVKLDSLRDRVQREGLTNVTFIPAQPFDQMTGVLAQGDLHYIALSDLPLFSLTLPSKVQATLAAGRPILGALRGDAARVINESGAGACCEPGDVAGLERTVRHLSADPEAASLAAAAARNYYEANFSERSSSSVLADLLRAAAAREGAK